MNNQNLLFVYRNSKNIISAREVTDVVEDTEYLQAYCMLSDELRTFRKDRVLDYAENKEELEEKLKFHIENTPARNGAPLKRRNRDHCYEIVFTGFTKQKKKELIEFAEEAGFYVTSGVTVNLDILCTGGKPGPDKIKKARAQGVPILSDSQLISLIETGEIEE